MLSAADIATYERDGVLVLPSLFTPDEVRALREAFDRDVKIPGGHRICEPGGSLIRAVYASHQRQAEYAALTRSGRLLVPAQQLLGPELYVYQLKINAKLAFTGVGWAWHQDYIAWKIADNVPAPKLINAVIFLNDVNEYNGPIIFIPGSHNHGVIRADRSDVWRSAQHLDPDDIALSPAELSSLVDRYGMASPKGKAGTVVFFHPEIVHGSAANLSPFPRLVAIITYNQTCNVPQPVGEQRPHYLVCRDTRPLQCDDDSLLLTQVLGGHDTRGD
jgi:ectoine hydroxylase